MVTARLVLLLLGAHSVLTATLGRGPEVIRTTPVELVNKPVPQVENEDVNELPVFLGRTRRGSVSGYSGSSSETGAFSGGGFGNGGFSSVGFGNGNFGGGNFGGNGFTGGYAGNFGPNFPLFPPFNFPQFPQAATPYDMNSLFNMYFNAALQNYQENLQQLQNRFQANLPPSGNNPGNGIAVSGPGYFAFASGSSSHPGGTHVSVSAPPGATVQHFEGPGGLQGVSVSHQTFSPDGSAGSSAGGATFGGGTFSAASSGSNQPDNSQISVSAPSGATVQHFEGPGGFQGVSVSHQTFSPDGSAGSSAGGGGGTFSVASSGSNQPGNPQISVSAPPGATVQHFEGPGGLQGVSVSHQSVSPGGSGGGASYGGVFTSVSSSSSNLNGETSSFHSATTGVNNNGQVSSITVTKP